jgi:hypothetical protein
MSDELIHLYYFSLNEEKRIEAIRSVVKSSPRSTYMKFNLLKLRFIADKIREGVVRCAELHIYLRFRDQPVHKVPEPYRAYVRESLPHILRVPRHLKLSPNP